MSGDPAPLEQRIAAALAAPVDPAVTEFAAALAAASGARAVLFYGSNLRTGSLEGVLDFYILLPGDAEGEATIWPTVSYHEREHATGQGQETLRAKVATMRLATFARAAAGDLTDTTIWARFVQPSALVWADDAEARADVTEAIAAACMTAARLAAALGPESGAAQDYWRTLFRATYEAEFRVEKSGRENDILAVNAAHFAGLLPLAWEAGGIPVSAEGERLTPDLPHWQRSVILKWWARRRRMGKPLNLLRLVKASTTFEGAARYAAWKIERHSGMPVEVTPFRERFPLLAAPQVLWNLWRHRRKP
ncbi:hypothetical protein [Erythrobacter dokdonensis]|uniref:Cytosolic protein n=1 Tax=Erythrobacter dokdonensis DSW-74 TaxID=1300349 RepID=A0A1A7BGL1_9SPHN|nr:hypothetical protein [Erythrobacter dokdonensis]OBV10866.1 hypothetical protein I603_2079 [Erythrobacter dokdonensis DSW-74]